MANSVLVCPTEAFLSGITVALSPFATVTSTRSHGSPLRMPLTPLNASIALCEPSSLRGRLTTLI